jgi:hypothetical protein
LSVVRLNNGPVAAIRVNNFYLRNLLIWRMMKEIQVLSTDQGMTHARNMIDAHVQDFEVNGELLLPS